MNSYEISSGHFDGVHSRAGNVPNAESGRRAWHVLIVDDDDGVCSVCSAMLTRNGYAVTVSQNGVDGFDIFSREPNRYDLVLSDEGMPGMSGRVLAAKVKAIRPDVPVLLMSGCDVWGLRERNVESVVNGVIAKPLRMRNFLDTVAELIGAKPAPTA